jgi:hypothetical protein
MFYVTERTNLRWTMKHFALQAMRGHCLDAPGSRQGISCGELGPMLGPIRLLDKTPTGFVPRPVAELNDLLGQTFGKACDCSDPARSLGPIAQALNEGSMARAMIGTQLLNLPMLSASEADRAIRLLQKASPDDPVRPGWPKDTEGGLGGKFRPKEGGMNGEALVKSKARRLILRRALRAGFLRVLSPKRALRLTGEIASNVLPGIDIVGDAALIADVADMVEEFEALKTDTDAALEYIERGPQNLDDIRVSTKDESFSSYSSFTKEDLAKRFGSAGEGYEYHHIVEQSAGDAIPTEEIQSTRNIVRIPKILHEEISAESSSNSETYQGRVRDSLRGKSFDEQYQHGVNLMRNLGIIQ